MTSERIRVSQWVGLIKAEYEELPGLNLSKPQMQRLWGLDPAVCDALVDALVAAQVLRRTATGTYVAHGLGCATLAPTNGNSSRSQLSSL